MKKVVITLSILFASLHADLKMDVYKLYQDKMYDKACQMANSVIQNYSEDESFISLYGFSCLKSDHINELSYAITHLNSTKESRANAAYFSVILMQKTLLMHALSDQYDLNAIKVPTSDYLLSTVFDLYTKDTNSKKRRRYNYKDPINMNRAYRLYIIRGEKAPKIVIEVYENQQMTKRHIYW